MEGYINFKKPQNEMFKKLDGKIQKIVDAHSNLNKLYALNDFPSYGGPKTPLELPPQLPPPPPWVPKVGQKIEENLDTDFAHKSQNKNLSPDERRKFLENLIDVLKQQIAAKSSKFKFTTPTKPKQNNPQSRSLLLKSSPQTLFNTIRRETSLLLSKRDVQQAAPRSGLSLLSQQQNSNCYQQNSNRFQQQNQSRFQQTSNRLQQNSSPEKQTGLNIRPLNQLKQQQIFTKLHHTIRVVVPPRQLDLHGLKFNNYLDREIPQPTNDKITIEQFAKCLNLVRTNDASLQRRREQLSEAESRNRLPLSNRPIRLKRLRGEKIYMPPSASYKATRKAGLQ